MMAELTELLGSEPILKAIAGIVGEGEVYLVGGAIRDAYLRRPLHDLDLATASDGRKWAQKVANHLDGVYYPLDPERGVGRAIVEFEGQRYVIDAARYRGASLDDDLRGRDFTINAMALPMSVFAGGSAGGVIDPLGGLDDLRQKRLRQCAPTSISDDPIRALRGVRQSVAFKLLMERATREAIKANAARITENSPERVRDEFLTILGGPRPHVALRTMDVLGLLVPIIPEVDPMRGVAQSAPHIYDVWEHTLSVVERLDGVLLTFSPARTDDSAADSAYGLIVYLLDRYRHQILEHIAIPLPNGRSVRALLMLGALLHDCGKPPTRSLAADGRIHFYQHERIGAELAEARAMALRLSNEETARLAGMVRHHMRPMLLRLSGSEVSRRAIYRYWNATGDTGVDVCLLTLADYLGMVGSHLEVTDWLAHLQIVGALLDGYYNRRAEVVAPPPLVTGRDLMQALALKPGPEVGRLLAIIGEAQAAGEISTSEEALSLAAKAHSAPQNGYRDGE